MPLPKLKAALSPQSRSSRNLAGSGKTAGSMLAAPMKTRTVSLSFSGVPAHLPSGRLATRRGLRCRGASRRSTSCTKAAARQSGSSAAAFAASGSVARRKTMLARAFAEVMFTINCTMSVNASASWRSPESTPLRMPGTGPFSVVPSPNKSWRAKKYLGTSWRSSGCHQRPMRGRLGGSSTVTSGRMISQVHRRPSRHAMASVAGMLRRRPASTCSHWAGGNSSYLRPTPPRGATK
mmetsp:Transcript_94840/g.265575  ORF Transcript_94840/g.265575 Transcript_94840/m.265575 type:complete len:236 (-) Transcript_94840:732-1439(-)